ncbi:FMN-binding negative transcriptional regulator [Stenotrophomonas lactitubi]|uniref:FMN-binding negative transcriptional regulator n=1 Tax=Stenotrophomonas lactitubi TaxID=2045214 RepID=UPI001D708CF8|nr:FMN-binding negative transcriptional regulator [Stenotrophomonas lactitubi]CAH0128931.1 Protease synthase and sporulation protein PAI 2 [Stenotrophomonas lactitubi]CAH0143020.1 Protease synthase and sporulation protein PAI 2 [Stenotrophomonas lactitubi]CAH0154578.1 Protease synthase and sporulation protein PAI 2 [Stenotrophomonas lactitubi]CAH0190071.1 Protease synthase and sporulation protein PAI 2 [Stenotrophomonas lactitubi]
MFTPRAFAQTDLQWLDRLLARDPFVTVLTTGADGLPELSRLPVLYRRDGDRIELLGHWARANPQARQGGPAKVLVDGPHGYLSPSWYPDKEPMARVPTWNYATAELRGQLHTFDDEDALADLVVGISDHFEASVGQHWRFEPERDSHRRQLRGIIGLRFEVEQVQLKLKLSQNHPEANQQAAIAELERLGTPHSTELAQWMRLRRDEAATGS